MKVGSGSNFFFRRSDPDPVGSSTLSRSPETRHQNTQLSEYLDQKMQLSTNGKIMGKVYGQHKMESVGYTVKTLMNVTIPAEQGTML